MIARSLQLMMPRFLAMALVIAWAGHSPTVHSKSSEQLTEAEQQLREDQSLFKKTVFAGVMTGAIKGAAIGAGASLLRDITSGRRPDSNRALKTGLAGGVIGGTVTGVDAYRTAKKEQAQREHIRHAEAIAKDVEQDNARMQSYLESSDRVLAEGEARLVALRSDLEAKKISQRNAQSALKREQANIASMQETLQTAKQARDNYQNVAATVPAQDKPNVDLEIKRMTAQIDKLEANITAYGEALQVSRA